MAAAGALALVARSAPTAAQLPGGCSEAVITEASARAIFEALQAPRPGDGCALLGVRTERTRMEVTWAKDGHAVEMVSVLPTSCATRAASGLVFSVAAPPAAAAACPASLSALRTLVTGLEAPPEPAHADEGPPAPPASRWLRLPDAATIWKWIGYAVALCVPVAMAFAVRRALERRRRPEPLLLRRLGLFVVSWAISFVALELGLRGYLRYVHPIGRFLAAMYRADPDCDFALRPNLRLPVRMDALELDFMLDTNGQGLRGRREIDPKAAGEYRILVLGDSYAFGFGVESDQTFSRLLEDQLRAGTGRIVRVVNAGVPAYGTAQELKFYRHHRAELAPDLVVLAFYANDYVDNMKRYVYADGFLMTEPVLFGGHPSVAFELVSKKVAHPDRLLLDGDSFDGRIDESRTHALLGEIQALCRDEGHAFLLLDIPDREVTRFALERDKRRVQHAPLPVPSEALVDLLPPIQRLESTPYLHEGHLNREGHALASASLVPIVARVIVAPR
jgi:hypothetical protein